MNRTVLYVLLIVSVAFNVCFAVGFFEARVTAAKVDTPEGPGQLLAQQLRLTEPQRQTLAELRAKSAGPMRELNQQRQANNRAIWAELAKPRPDRLKIRGLVEQNARHNVEMRTLALERFGELAKSLTPAQREELQRILRSRHAEAASKPQMNTDEHR